MSKNPPVHQAELCEFFALIAAAWQMPCKVSPPNSDGVGWILYW